MSTNQTSSQDRLKKIEKKQASAPQQAASIDTPQPRVKPEFGAGPQRESAIGTGTLLVVGAVVGALALGAVLFRDVMAPTQDLTAEVMGDGGQRQVSLLGRILGGSFDPQSVRAQLPIYHLPDPPENFIRATKSDVRKINAIDQLRNQWPEGSGPNFVTLDKNPGFGRLSTFVAQNQVKTTRSEEEARRSAVAYYLSSTGSHVFVTLRFLQGEENLGPVDAPEIWAETLRARGLAFKDAKARIGQMGDLMTVGQGRVSLDPKSTSPTPVDLAVPLTPKVFIKISGKVTPSELDALISDVNVPALLAFAGRTAG